MFIERETKTRKDHYVNYGGKFIAVVIGIISFMTSRRIFISIPSLDWRLDGIKTETKGFLI